MNFLLLTLHQIAKKLNSLGTTACQTRKNSYQILQGFDLMILLCGLLHEYSVRYCPLIYLYNVLSLCNLVDIIKVCPHAKRLCKKV